VVETWHITKSGDCCCACGKEFARDRLLFSCLVENEAGFERRDLCPDCWETAAPETVFCFWRTRRAVAERKPVLDTAVMLEFFERLGGAREEQKRAFRFVLALYLMRRKELKLIEVSRDSAREALVLERRSDGRRVEVENPGITEERLQDIAARLSELLNACLDGGQDAPSP